MVPSDQPPSPGSKCFPLTTEDRAVDRRTGIAAEFDNVRKCRRSSGRARKRLLARRTSMPGQLKRLHDIRRFTLDAMSIRRVGIDRELLTAVQTKVRRVDPSAKRTLWFGMPGVPLLSSAIEVIRIALIPRFDSVIAVFTDEPNAFRHNG